MSTTRNTIVTGALHLLGVVDPEETPAAAMLEDGGRRLNLMLGQWALQNLTIPAVARHVFDWVANQASYTIGTGGNFNTPRPFEILSAALLDPATPTIETPLAIYTDAAYAAIPVKGQTGGQPAGIYYRATVAGGLGTIVPWPIPDNAADDLVLYLWSPLAQFTSGTAVYQLPDGAGEALEYNLTFRLAPTYSVPVPPDVKDIAKTSLAVYKRSNTRISDVGIDPMFGAGRGASYNIVTGTGG